MENKEPTEQPDNTLPCEICGYEVAEHRETAGKHLCNSCFEEAAKDIPF
jgi:formylmethanofuran dehydrogenase subunit E